VLKWAWGLAKQSLRVEQESLSSHFCRVSTEAGAQASVCTKTELYDAGLRIPVATDTVHGHSAVSALRRPELTACPTAIGFSHLTYISLPYYV